MSDECKRCDKFYLAIAIATLSLLAIYVSGYFACSERDDLSDEGFGVERCFDSPSLCRMYFPLGWCECKITGETIFICRWMTEEDPGYSFEECEGYRVALGEFEP